MDEMCAAKQPVGLLQLMLIICMIRFQGLGEDLS